MDHTLAADGRTAIRLVDGAVVVEDTLDGPFLLGPAGPREVLAALAEAAREGRSRVLPFERGWLVYEAEPPRLVVDSYDGTPAARVEVGDPGGWAAALEAAADEA